MGSAWTSAGLVVLAMVMQALAGEGRTFYVSPRGNDAWRGLAADAKADGGDGPFRTLGRAVAALDAGDTCVLRGGVYCEMLQPAKSGREGAPITFAAYPGETPVLSGADPVMDWKKGEGGIWSAAMDWDLKDQNQLFCDGAMLAEARWPNGGSLLQPVRAKATAGTATTLTDPNLPGTKDAWTGAYLWCAGGSKWICWAAEVTAFDPTAKTLTFRHVDKGGTGPWYDTKAGSEYVLMGAKFALDAPGEWLYDRTAKRVLLIPPGGKDPNTLAIEAKRRVTVIALSGLSHIQLVGLHFRAGGIATDDKSERLLLKGLRGEYLAHSFLHDMSDNAVRIRGLKNVVHSCELAYSSGCLLSMSGRENKLINCFIHDGDYGGKWRGTVDVRGRRHVVSHNTIRDSGRDLVTIHGLMESVIQYNDLSAAGWLTQDLGMTYGHNTDFANTVIHHNYVHDNKAKHVAMGIYFDHLSHNVIVHHNVVWNVGMDPIRVNNPSYFNLIYNNSCWCTGSIGTFDHSKREDLFGTRFWGNIFNAPHKLPDHVVWTDNSQMKEPAYVDPAGRRFELKDAESRMGAVPAGRDGWKAGHNFEHPPTPEPAWTPPDVPWMNAVTNACFELGTLEGWTPTDGNTATLTKGNGWGNGFGEKKAEKTGTSAFELRLGGGTDGVEQRIEGLHPDTAYKLSAWVKVSDPAECVCLGVRDHGAAAMTVESRKTEWTRLVLEFKTDPGQTAATIFLRKTSPSGGHAWCDNVGLPRRPGR